MKLFWELFFRDGDAGGAGGGAGDGGDKAGAGGSLAEAAAAAKTGGEAGAGGADAEAWFPKDLDAQFKGKDAGETLANLAKHLAGQPRPPADAKDYTFKPDETISQFFGTDKDNQVLDVFRGVAKDLGLSQTQFEGAINKFYGSLISSGMMPAPVSVESEFTALGGAQGTPAERMQKGQERVVAMVDTLRGLETAGVLEKGEADLLSRSFTRAGEIAAIERLFKHIESLSPAGGPGNGGGGDRQMTDHEAGLRRMYPSMFKQ